MRNYTGKCEYCGKVFERYSSVRRRFCDDKCRVASHRLQKRPDAERTLFVICSVIKQKIEAMQRSIERRASELPNAVGIRKQSLEQLIREDEQQIELLQSLLTLKNNLEHEAKIDALYDVDPVNYD